LFIPISVIEVKIFGDFLQHNATRRSIELVDRRLLSRTATRRSRERGFKAGTEARKQVSYQVYATSSSVTALLC
jgi:hypothetical protein